MAKEKTKDSKRTANSHLRARIAFLQKASAHLASTLTHTVASNDAGQPSNDDMPRDSRSLSSSASTPPISRHLATNLRSVARKSQVRLSSDVKHSICKVCDAQLVPGITSTTTMENVSRNGSKPHAEMKIITCRACSATKRFPVGANRQSKKKDRQHRKATATASLETDHDKT